MNNLAALLNNNNNDILFGYNSMGTLIKKHKQNDILQFLIILTDENYINKSFFGGKSLYEKLIDKKSLFYGNLEIKKLSEFTNDPNNTIANKYLIDGNIIPRIVYMKLPKEQLYVPAETFQDRYLDSKINELISIFTTLHAETIKMSIIHENSSSIKLSFGAGVNVNGLEASADASKTNDKGKIIKTSRTLTFQEPSQNAVIDSNAFLNHNKFYYLPKDEGWIEIIRQRISKKAKDNEYTYNYTENSCFSVDLSAQLQALHINFAYNSSKYENLKIEYNITYFPFTGDVDMPMPIPNQLETTKAKSAPIFATPLDVLNPLKWFSLFG